MPANVKTLFFTFFTLFLLCTLVPDLFPSGSAAVLTEAGSKSPDPVSMPKSREGGSFRDRQPLECGSSPGTHRSSHHARPRHAGDTLARRRDSRCCDFHWLPSLPHG